MLRRNTTRTKFAVRFKNIIDEYNAGVSQNDDFYEKLLKLREELRAEERYIKEELSEVELELFELLRKEYLTSDEEKRVKLAAKELSKKPCKTGGQGNLRRKNVMIKILFICHGRIRMDTLKSQ